MPLLLLIAAGAIALAWWSGKLKAFSADDAIALIALPIALRLAITGKPLIGLGVGGAAFAWAAFQRVRHVEPAMAPDEARRLLGVGLGASLADIRAAHRRLIARVHPDSGGSAELASRVNQARDALIAEAGRGAPRQSRS